MSEQVLDLIVTGREERSESVVVLDLVAPEGRTLPTFQAGAHVDVHIGPEIVRQYSLCGNPADATRYRLGILRDPQSRGGSVGLHDGFAIGESIRVGFPRNHFPLDDGADHSVLVGGGIGVTPLLAMAYALSQEGRSFELHYCARHSRSAAFLEELRAAPFADRLHLHFSAEPESRRMTLDDLPASRPGMHLYVCGPAAFMDWLIDGALARGYATAQIHREYFTAEVDASGGAFDVVLAQSGRIVTVPDGVSIVKALGGAGVKVDVSCENGVCGTCLCNVLEGIPDHRDSYLTNEEREANDQMLVCCSRAKTPRLVLDL